MDKVLEVKNLKVSFRSQGGIVKAVRDISFDLEKGKTMAIVGESGSGKSVTSKAILGILAGNSIIEGGEILYDGKDLLTINENDMYKIRGDKISMIFQDPLSSLNPIVKIGKQITEAMLLKSKVNRREARADFNATLAILKKAMVGAGVDKATVDEAAKTFDRFSIEAIKLETPYMDALALTEELKAEMEDFLFLVEKKQNPDVKALCKDFYKKLLKIQNPFHEKVNQTALTAATESFNKERTEYKASTQDGNVTLSPSFEESIKKCISVLADIISEEKPNFFRLGYYKLNGNDVSLDNTTVKAINEKALAYLDENFMKNFLEIAGKGVAYSHSESLKAKKNLLDEVKKAEEFFKGSFTKKEAIKYANALADKVEASIDRVEINKNSTEYTFRTSLVKSVEKYFEGLEKNPKEEARFKKQTAKREALIAKGKRVDWKVVPKTVYDVEDLKNHLVVIVTRLEEHYNEEIASTEFNASEKVIALVDYFKEKASQVVHKVTKAMAREKAIKLMEEVGIHEPRRRYYQYPFEFSGGMRQRIVIAIALAANPEILICDEPTTALDVTIQAQILELINKLKRDRNISIIFITHDLGVVANMADDIAVMYAGKIVEYGTADDIFYDPRHPYTWALLGSMPDLDTNEKLESIPGTPPNMIYPPVGDAFAARNKYAMQIDFEEQPPMFQISETHKAATWLLHPDAPKVEMPKIISERIERMKAKEGQN